MPKMKTNKSVKSRFKVTGTGLLKFHHSGRRHILTKKSRKRKRHLKKAAIIAPAQTKTFLTMLAK